MASPNIHASSVESISQMRVACISFPSFLCRVNIIQLACGADWSISDGVYYSKLGRFCFLVAAFSFIRVSRFSKGADSLDSSDSLGLMA